VFTWCVSECGSRRRHCTAYEARVVRQFRVCLLPAVPLTLLHKSVWRCSKSVADASFLYDNASAFWRTIKWTSCISIGYWTMGCWNISELKSIQKLENLKICRYLGGNCIYFEYYNGDCCEISLDVWVRLPVRGHSTNSYGHKMAAVNGIVKPILQSRVF
jgi:hypothetical protein